MGLLPYGERSITLFFLALGRFLGGVVGWTMGRTSLSRGGKVRAFSPLGFAVAVVLLLLGSVGPRFAAGQTEGLDVEQVCSTRLVL